MAFLGKLSHHSKIIEGHVDNLLTAYFWSDVPSFEEIEMNTSCVGNIDWILCGIFPEEVAELEGKTHGTYQGSTYRSRTAGRHVRKKYDSFPGAFQFTM